MNTVLRRYHAVSAIFLAYESRLRCCVAVAGRDLLAYQAKEFWLTMRQALVRFAVHSQTVRVEEDASHLMVRAGGAIGARTIPNITFGNDYAMAPARCVLNGVFLESADHA